MNLEFINRTKEHGDWRENLKVRFIKVNLALYNFLRSSIEYDFSASVVYHGAIRNNSVDYPVKKSP